MVYSRNIKSCQRADITATVKFLGLVVRYNSWLKSTLQHGEVFPRYGVKVMAEIVREELNTVPFPGNKDTEAVGVCTRSC